MGGVDIFQDQSSGLGLRTVAADAISLKDLFAELQPKQGRLADVDATVLHKRPEVPIEQSQ